MKNNSQNAMIKIVSFVLILALVIPANVNAAQPDTATPYASDYLCYYSVWIERNGGGSISICFDVQGNTSMDELGVLSIVLYESIDNSTWYHVKTYNHANYGNMISLNDWWHTSSLNYYGVSGRYYKAYITIWAGKNGGGDTRYLWTNVYQAY